MNEDERGDGPRTFGWYSVAGTPSNGLRQYRTPSGEMLCVTFVSDSPTDSESSWPDAVCLGEVTEFVAVVQPPGWFDRLYAEVKVALTRADVADALTRADTDRFAAAMSAMAKAWSPAEQRAAVVELVCAVLGVSDAE